MPAEQAQRLVEVDLVHSLAAAVAGGARAAGGEPASLCETLARRAVRPEQVDHVRQPAQVGDRGKRGGEGVAHGQVGGDDVIVQVTLGEGQVLPVAAVGELPDTPGCVDAEDGRPDGGVRLR